MDSQPLLDVIGLCYSYGLRTAVSEVSFSVRPGECFGVLGPNGAGKTTTLLCIAGLLGNWQGDLKFNGQAFRPASRLDDRRRMGMVPQEIALYENLSAKENLQLFAELSGVSSRDVTHRVDEQLELAGLSSRQRDLVGQFSGGMKRRLNLAAGMLHRPPLILLDEPTVGVDPQSRNHLFDSLERIKASGTTLLYTTHYMEEAQRLCDRIAIMNEGSIIAMGTPRELAQQTGDPDANLEHVFLQLTGRSLRDE